MHQDSFGSLLADARKQCDYTVEDVANVLRIRPDIVLTIERGDLHSLPPRAYTRNMILRYARFVRLDASYILKLYDDQSASAEIADVRSTGSSSLRTGQFGTVSSRPGADERDYGERQAADIPAGQLDRSDYRAASDIQQPASYVSSRNMHTAYSSPAEERGLNDGYGYASPSPNRRTYVYSEEQDRPQRQSRLSATQSTSMRAEREFERFTSHDDRSSSSGASRTRKTHQSTRSALPDAHPTNFCSPQKGSATPIRSSKPIILAILAILVVVIVIAIVAVTSAGGNSTSNAKQTTVPISGLTDTASGNEQDVQSIVVPTAPTSVEFAYSVQSGAESYIEIYVDDSTSLAEVVTGPSKGSYNVTGKLKFVCTQPDGITLTVDGTEVAMTPDEDTSWIYQYEIDFSEYLAQWQEEHAEEIAAAQKAKEELLAAQAAASDTSSAGSGTDSNSSSSGKTTTSN